MDSWVFLWIFLIFVSEYQCEQYGFFRCINDTKLFEFTYFVMNAPLPYDIYAKSKRSTCGLRSGALTGSGTPTDNYILTIDLSAGLAKQNPDCGVRQGANNILIMEMVIQTKCEVETASDKKYQSSCPMVIPSSDGKSQRRGKASYVCMSPSTIVFNFQQTNGNLDAPADIYAMSNRASCSKSSGSGSGDGSASKPFTMRIVVHSMTFQCGVQHESPNVYSVLIYVQQFSSILTSSDVLYQVKCDFDSSSTLGIETEVIPAGINPPIVNATQNLPKASLTVVTASGNSLTSLTVGDPIRLVAQLLNGPAVGLRVTSCQASPGPSEQPVLTLLDSKGCSTTPNLVPPFIGQAPTGSMAMNNEFKAFKFDQSDTVYFSCQTNLCYDSDLSCLGSHCDGNRRRKREALPDVNSLNVGLLISVREHPNGISSNFSRRSNNLAFDDITKDDRWPLAAMVTTSCLAAVCVTFILITIVLFSRLKRRTKS